MLIPVSAWLILVTSVMCTTIERKLVQDLLSSYHNIRPASDLSQPTKVNVSLKLVKVFELSAKQQVLVTSVWMEQCWTDSLLKWNKTDYGGIDELSVMVDNIWVPDIVLLNNADSTTMGKPVNRGNNLLISSSGTVRSISPVILKSSCKLNVRYFPFDEQLCGLEFTTWTSGQSEVLLQPQIDNIFENYSESSEWILRGSSIMKTTPALDINSNETRSGVKYMIRIERQVFYYFFYLITPCMLVSLIILVLFMLPPDCGELMVVGVTLLLSLTVFFLLASTHIPETSEVVPLIGRYYSLTIIEVSCSLGLICWVLRFHHHSVSSGTVPRWIRIYILGYVAKVLRYPIPKEVDVSFQATQEHNAGDETDEDIEASDQINKQDNKPEDCLAESNGRLTTLRMMEAQVIKKKENDKKQEEWQLVAMVINRLFMVVYIVTFILTLVGIFSQVPHLFSKESI